MIDQMGAAAGRSATMVDMPGRVSSPQFVGREPELGQLEDAFKAAAAEERATTVLLGGEAGVGKTRLVAELAGRVRAAGGLVLSGSCLELANAPLPFGPLVQALRARCSARSTRPRSKP